MVRSIAPGRICLFGEHQDYMSLPVITAAIDLTIEIEGNSSTGSGVLVELPDIGERDSFKLSNIVYRREKDYIRSSVNLLLKKEMIRHRLIKAKITRNIPQRAGTSSSSALCVSWVSFLLNVAGKKRYSEIPKSEIAELAYLAEVEEFNESGGRMDQYASALGGINYFAFHRENYITPLPAKLHGFVLGDSGEPKDTQKTLRRIRRGQEEGLKMLKKFLPFPSNHDIDYNEAQSCFKRIDAEFRPYLNGVLLNHKITESAYKELSVIDPDPEIIAELMNCHHSVLRDDLKLSTKKIERMIDAAIGNGALSAKINGSGEGGCMFAYCPGHEDAVAEAITREGGRAYRLKIHPGITIVTE